MLEEKINTNDAEQITKAIKGYIYDFISKHTIVKRNLLLLNLKNNGVVVSDRSMRKLVERMVIVDGIPIGSTTEGYFLVRSKEDLLKALNELKSKAKSLSIRANCLRKSAGFNEKVLQLDMFEV